MFGSQHSSPAVRSMMRDQVVAATRGLAELCCGRLSFSLMLTKGVSAIFIGYCRPGRPTRRYSVAIPAARTLIVGRVRYSGVSGRSSDKIFWNRYSGHPYIRTTTVLINLVNVSY